MAHMNRKRTPTDQVESGDKKQGGKTHPANKPATQTAKPATKPNVSFGSNRQTQK